MSALALASWEGCRLVVWRLRCLGGHLLQSAWGALVRRQRPAKDDSLTRGHAERRRSRARTGAGANARQETARAVDGRGHLGRDRLVDG